MSGSRRDPDARTLPVVEIHDAVDRAVAPLERRHRDRLTCRSGCHTCCVDGLTVFEVEAERVRSRHRLLLAHGEPYPEGACAFLDPSGACRIYTDRPYVCRTQGLPLRWIDTRDDERHEPVEYRDICPLNETSVPVEDLPSEACFELGPFEARLATLERRSHRPSRDGSLRRVALRSLFTRR